MIPEAPATSDLSDSTVEFKNQEPQDLVQATRLWSYLILPHTTSKDFCIGC